MDTVRWEEVVAVPMARPKRLFAARDGSLVAIGSQHVFLLEPDAKKPVGYAAPSVFPNTVFFADGRRADRFWALHFSKLLQQHEIGDSPVAGVLPIVETYDLAGTGHEAMTMLRDGAFLMAAGERLVRMFPGGRSRTLVLPHGGSSVWRLLASRRIDRAWVVYRSGEARLFDVGGKGKSVRLLRMQPRPYDVGSGGRFLAQLHYTARPDGALAWTITVYDEAGRQRMDADLPPSRGDPSPVSDWVVRETANREVAVSATRPWVAVGGPSALTVWEIESGRRLYER